MKKRLLALLLCLSMLLSFTVSTYAEGNGDLSSHGYYDDFEDVAGSGDDTTTDGGTTEIPVVPAPVDPAPGAPTQPGFDDEKLPGVTLCEECGAANGHTEDCSQYVAPKDESDAKHSYYELDKVAGACKECGQTDGHLESCSQYVAEFSVEAFYAQVMSAGSVDEIDDLFAALTDEELALVESTLTEEQIAALSAYVEELEALEAANAFVRPVDVTNAAPFLPPVVGEEELVMDVPMVYNMRTLMASASANSYAVMPLADEGSSSSTTTRVDNAGVVTTKTATMNADGTKATIRLETYVTGSKVTTTVKEEVPTDIVLVLDQSGSMDKCIGCGGNVTDRWGNPKAHTVYTYTAINGTPSTSGTYYYKNGSSYSRAYYCGGGSWYGYDCDAGWYTEQHSDYYHGYNGEKLDPETVTFYTRDSGTEVDCESRLDALTTALTNFTSAVETKAAGPDGDITTANDNVNHRIAVVGFASSGESYNDSPYENTELYIGGTTYGYTTASNQYKNAFQDMDTDAGQTNVAASIGALDAYGGTYPELGLEMANGIFDANPISSTDGERNRVVILFTDGMPGQGNYFEKGPASNAIYQTSLAKKDGATVYTVGIFSGADATVPMPSNIDNVNKYMHYASTNFPDATSMDNPGDADYPDDGSSYYLSASDSDALNNIFQAISEKIESSGGASITLNSSTVVQDVMSQYFTLPAGTTKDQITVKTATYKGGDASLESSWTDDGVYKEADVNVPPTDPAKVTVSNFDFSVNYVGYDTAADGKKTARGKKLIIEFEAEPKAGFWGGNGVPTNDLSSSGVYNSEGTLVENFEEPKVDVPVAVPEVSVEDKNVYLGNGLTTDQLQAGATITLPGSTDTNGDGTIDPVVLNVASLTTDLAAVPEWQKKFVTVSTNPANATDKLAADSNYTIACTVSANSEPEKKNSSTQSDTGAINVFVPVIKIDDSTIYLSQVPGATYANNVRTISYWEHGSTKSTDNGVTILGTEPVIDATWEFAYDVQGDNAGNFTDCKPIKGWTTKVNGVTYESNKAPFTVHILKPHVAVTLADTTRYYGDQYTAAGGKGEVSWTDDNTAHTVIPPATGKAPYDSATLKYYSDAEKTKEFDPITMPDRDVKVYVKAFNGSTVLPATFKTTCAVAGHNCEEHTNGYYIVHPDFCELTINKTVTNAYDANDTFLFKVKGGNSPYSVDMDVVIQGSGSVTIGHLPVGSYTVTEDETWSWRYDITVDQAKSKTLSSGSPSRTWAITNDLGSGNKDKWLTFSGVAENTWSNGIDKNFVMEGTVTKKENQARRKASK